MSHLITLRPGARGTIQLVQQYGKQLICVRYRYNRDTLRRIKTVELVIDERAWQPRKRVVAPTEQMLPAESDTGNSNWHKQRKPQQ